MKYVGQRGADWGSINVQVRECAGATEILIYKKNDGGDGTRASA